MQRSAQSNKPWMPAFCAWRCRHSDIAGVIENPNWQPDGKGWFLPHNSVHYDGAIVHIDFARKDRAPIHLLDYPFLHTLRMSFGKYRGELVYEVPEIDIGYVNWLLRQPWSPCTRHLFEGAFGCHASRCPSKIGGNPHIASASRIFQEFKYTRASIARA